MFCGDGFDTMQVVIYCAMCIGLLSAEFSTVNTGFGGPMVLETSVSGEYSCGSCGYHKLSTYIDYLNF